MPISSDSVAGLDESPGPQDPLLPWLPIWVKFFLSVMLPIPCLCLCCPLLSPALVSSPGDTAEASRALFIQFSALASHPSIHFTVFTEVSPSPRCKVHPFSKHLLSIYYMLDTVGEGRSMVNQTQAQPSVTVWSVCCLGPAFAFLTYLSCPHPQSLHRPEQPTSAAGMPELLPLQVHGGVPCVQNFLSLPAPIGMQPSQPSTCPCLGSLHTSPVPRM